MSRAVISVPAFTPLSCCQRAVYAVYAVYTHRVGLTGLGILSPDRLIYAVRRLILHTTQGGEIFRACGAAEGGWVYMGVGVGGSV